MYKILLSFKFLISLVTSLSILSLGVYQYNQKRQAKKKIEFNKKNLELEYKKRKSKIDTYIKQEKYLSKKIRSDAEIVELTETEKKKLIEEYLRRLSLGLSR